MAVSLRRRRILWISAGGCCSICRVLLVTEGTETEDPSVFGQEAHIMSAAPDGPRHGPLPNYDVYDNLILLCSKHHKQVDDQVGHYTVDRLKRIKREHEEWVRSRNDEPGPIRFVPDPKYPIPKALKLCITGTQLWNNMEGVRSFRPSWPDGLSEEQQDLTASFLDDLRDWMDVTSMDSSYKTGREAARHLGEHVKALAQAGLLIGTMQRHMLLTGGIKSEPWPWLLLDIELTPIRLARLADENGTPLLPNSDYESAYADLDTATARKSKSDSGLANP
jgi:hypothetical protein